MIRPSLNEVKKINRDGSLIPVVKEMVADIETPISAYLKMGRKPYSFLLESVEGGERLGRYSFIGMEPVELIKGSGENPIVVLRDRLKKFKAVRAPGLPRFQGGAVGYFAYEVARHFEKLPSPTLDPLQLPEYFFLLVDTILAFDHVTHKILIISHLDPKQGDVEAEYKKTSLKVEEMYERLKQGIPSEVNTFNGKGSKEQVISSNFTREMFEEAVRKAKGYIFEGEAIQIVISQRFEREMRAQPFDVYRSLRMINPSPYMYYMDFGDFHIIGSSPETLVRVDSGIVETHPIAGTRPRGKTPEEDMTLERELLQDEKERAEHLMLIDLGRNDIGRVSQPGSVKVTQLMEVERYSHVMHIVSHIQGELRNGLDCLDALKACFPAGTVSGAPKIRAMELIAELEPDKRGPYAGALGYMDFSGNLDMAIIIRTIISKGGRAYFQAGSGIVADSIPQREYEESVNKAKAALQAIEMAEGTYAPSH